jgi:hypothetical protein
VIAKKSKFILKKLYAHEIPYQQGTVYYKRKPTYFKEVYFNLPKKKKKTLVLDQLRSLTEHIEVKVEAFEELKEVRLGKSEGIVIKLGSTLELRQ